jgi:hypothetical protein
MALNPLSYLDDPNDPLSQLGAGGGYGFTPDMDLSQDPAALQGGNVVQLPQMDITAGDPIAPSPTDMSLDEFPTDGMPGPQPAAATPGLAAMAQHVTQQHPPVSVPGASSDDSSGYQVPALAMLADLVLNRGRGVGVIAAGAADMGDKKKKDQLEAQYKQAQINHLNRTQDTDLQMQLRQRALDLQQQRMSDAEANQKNKKTGSGDDTAGILSAIEAGGGTVTDEMRHMSPTALRTIMTQLNKQYDINNQGAIGESKGTQAAYIKKAQLDEDHAATDEKAADRAKIAGAEAAARGGVQLPIEQALKASPNYGEQVAADGGQTPSQALAQQKERRAASDQFGKETGDVIAQASSIDEIQKLVDKYPAGKLPGVGRVAGSGIGQFYYQTKADGGDSEAKDALAMQNARSTLRDFAQHQISGAVGSEAEHLRTAIREGAQDNATEQQLRTGVDSARRLARMSIARSAVGKEDAAHESLKAQGMDSWLDAPSASPAANDATAGVGELGVQKLPPKPDSSSGKREVTLTSPAGRSKRVHLSDSEIQKLTAAGWKVD